MTTVRELYESLKDILETEGGTEVLIASQPQWPFENQLDGLQVVEYAQDHPFDHTHSGICLDCGQPGDADDHQLVTKIYLVQGDQIGYLPSEAKEELGW